MNVFFFSILKSKFYSRNLYKNKLLIFVFFFFAYSLLYPKSYSIFQFSLSYLLKLYLFPLIFSLLAFHASNFFNTQYGILTFLYVTPILSNIQHVFIIYFPSLKEITFRFQDYVVCFTKNFIFSLVYFLKIYFL